jgi:protein transport protein DSL1/ZW10
LVEASECNTKRALPNHEQAEIHVINEETKDDVSSWVRNAKTLQEDIIRSKTIANDIVREAEAPDVSGEALEDAEAKAEFLNREVQYSSQLHAILQRVKRANNLLDDVEAACTESRVLDSLRLLERMLHRVRERSHANQGRILGGSRSH